MSDCGVTNFGGTFSISNTAQNDDLTVSELEGLSYTEVPNIMTIGETGTNQNVVSASTWDRPVICKGKGEANAGDPDLEFLDVASAGMDLMLAAAAYDNTDNYAFKIEWADGSKEYNRGIVLGPRFPKGANEDFKRAVFTLGLNQIVEVVAAP